jgi:hypothetical protein
MAIEWLDTTRDAIELFRAALSLSRDVQQALPKGEQAEAIAKALDEAEKKARLAEAQIAKALGYKLCQCTFPPQIMLLCRDDGAHPAVAEFHRCSACGREFRSKFSRQLGSDRRAYKLARPAVGHFDP